MSKNDRVIRSGPLRGKKITFASTDRIERFKAIADEFMSRVFELEPGEYMISDESDLLDFVPLVQDSADAWDRMKQAYGLEREELASTRLISIFEEIVGRRRPQ